MVYPLKHHASWPVRFSVYDIETRDWTEPLCVAFASEDGTTRVFRLDAGARDPVTAFLRWIFDGTDYDELHAHFARIFDTRFVQAACDALGWEWEAIPCAGGVVSLRVLGGSREKREVVFADSSYLIPHPLARVGAELGAPRGGLDRTRMREHWDRDPDAVCDHAVRDCATLLKGLAAVRDVLCRVGVKGGGGTLASSAARWTRAMVRDGLRWQSWYQPTSAGRFLRRPEFAAAEDFAAGAGFGGKNEVYAVGPRTGTFYYYDISAAYLALMLESLPLYPLDAVRTSRGLPVTAATGWDGPCDDQGEVARRLRVCGFSDAEVEIPADEYAPVLPSVHGGVMQFRTGLQRGRWSHVELAFALARGATVKLLRTSYWQAKPWLAGFARAIWPARQAARARGDRATAFVLKLAGNGVSGKLDERDGRERLVSGPYYLARAEQDAHRAGTRAVIEPVFGQRYQRATWDERGSCVHRAAAAWLRAMQRVRLTREVIAARAAGAQVYYVATDSIWTDKPVVVTGEGLGEWKLEAIADEVDFRAPALYRAHLLPDWRTERPDGVTPEWLCRAKGLPAKEGDPTAEEWLDYVEGDGVAREGLVPMLAGLYAGDATPRVPARPVTRRSRAGTDTKRRHEGGVSVPWSADDEE